MNMTKEIDVCIVGATGLVGQTMLEVLAEYDFPINRLKLCASQRSAGQVCIFKGKSYTVEALTEESFTGYQLALFSAGAEISKQYAPLAVAAGLLVIDNSSAWREDTQIPLVVPEVNIKDAWQNTLIANPNCSTIQSVVPLKALQDSFGLERVNYTTYQAVSGSGQQGVEELRRTQNGGRAEVYPYAISETAIPEIDRPMANGYTKEEHKMIVETKKILHQPNLPVSATCVRIPVERGHAVALSVTLTQSFELEDVKNVFENFPGIEVVDNLTAHQYPTSQLAKGNDTVYVGRIRRDTAMPNSLLFYTTADNIRKGAAGNAVQIAQALLEQRKEVG